MGVWSNYFTKHFSSVLSQGLDVLSKDFCLFSPQCRFIVVASSQPVRNLSFEYP